MEASGEVAEALCDVVQEQLEKKFLHNVRGAEGCHKKFTGGAAMGQLCRWASSTLTSGANMQGFNEKDAENLQRVKDAMAEKAAGGGVFTSADAAAAAAFAQLLDAETRRAELALKAPAQDKGQTAPAGSWTETVTASRRPDTAEQGPTV